MHEGKAPTERRPWECMRSMHDTQLERSASNPVKSVKPVATTGARPCWTSSSLLSRLMARRTVGPEHPFADPPDEGIAERAPKAKDKPWLAAEREHARYVGQHCRCHTNKEGPGVATVRAATPARIC
jgi:hypothetical protein